MAIGDIVGYFTGNAGATFTLSSNPNGYFSISGNNLIVAAAIPPNVALQPFTVLETNPDGTSVTRPISLRYTVSIGPSRPVTTFNLGLNYSGLEYQYPVITSLAEMTYYANKGITKIRM